MIRITGIDMEGRVPPLVFLLLQKLGGEVEVTDEEMEIMNDNTLVVDSWYDTCARRTSYRLRKEAPVVDGEVVDVDVPVQERRGITDGR